MQIPIWADGRPGGVILFPEDDVGRRPAAKRFGRRPFLGQAPVHPQSRPDLQVRCGLARWRMLSVEGKCGRAGAFFRRASQPISPLVGVAFAPGPPVLVAATAVLPTGDRSNHPRSINKSSMMTGPHLHYISRAALTEYSHFLVRDIGAHGRLCVAAWEANVSHDRHMSGLL